MIRRTLTSLVVMFLISSISSARAAGSECANWNTKKFFEFATTADVQACLARGANVAARDAIGETPLYLVARFQNVEKRIIGFKGKY